MVGDAVNTNAASNPAQKAVLTTAVASGFTGTARDAKSAEIAKEANSAFSPPSLNFGKTNPNNVFQFTITKFGIITVFLFNKRGFRTKYWFSCVWIYQGLS